MVYFLSILTPNHSCRALIPRLPTSLTSRALKSSWSNRLQVEALCLSNDVLPDRAQIIVCELLLEAQEDLASMNEDISRLLEIPESLMQRLRSSVERVERLSVGIAPHKKLPPEILAIIFIESLHDERVIVPPNVRMAPWNLGQVCLRWRAISRAEPLLWRLVMVKKRGRRFSASIIPALRDIFSRCGGEGEITLQVKPSCESDWEETLFIISTYSSRLWGLHLDLDKSCIRPLAMPLGALGNLQYLFLRCGFSLRNGIHISTFSTAQNLCDVNIWLLVEPTLLDNDRIVLPWAQLTELTVTKVPAALILRVLTGDEV